jgi:hypothetical protein
VVEKSSTGAGGGGEMISLRLSCALTALRLKSAHNFRSQNPKMGKVAAQIKENTFSKIFLTPILPI